VDTKIREEDSPHEGSGENPRWWNSEQRLAIAKVLLKAGRPLTPGEIAKRLHPGDQSNIRRAAEQMTTLGILQQHTPPKRENGRGRPARFAYSLTNPGKVALESHLETEVGEPGLLQEGGQLLVVTAEQDQLTDFYAVIEEEASGAQIQWATSVVGYKRRFLISLHGDGSEEQAEALAIALTETGIECSRSIVGRVFKGNEFAAYSKDLLEKARSTARKKTEREAAW
jgi:hypothetical protein